MRFFTRSKFFALAAVMAMSCVCATSPSVFAAEESAVENISMVEGVVTETNLKDGVKATSVEFTLDDPTEIAMVDVPNSIMATPRMWDKVSINFSSGAHPGAPRTFSDGNYLGYEVSVSPIGTPSSKDQSVTVELFRDGDSYTLNNRLAAATAHTINSSPYYKADWISISNSQAYRFVYSSSTVSSTYPLKVTVTYYTWNG